MLRFFNTLSRQIEEFHPLEEGKVRMYICGPTVWNFAHIGNFRTFVFGDVLRRYLKFKGYEVTHVFNLTDIDDRIINEAAARNISIDEFTAPYIQYFWEDFDALGNERPEVTPRATHHIAEMIDIIAKLLENGHAYESEGSIYYRITAFPEYGKLSKISFSGNKAGGSERIDTDKYDKEDARDFALWKLVGEDEEPGWDAPFRTRAARLAYRVLGDGDEISRRDFRPARGRNGLAVSASRKRDRPERRSYRKTVLEILAAQRVFEDRRRDDVQIEGQFLYFSRSARAWLFGVGDTIFAALCADTEAVEFYFRRVTRSRIDGRTAAEFSTARNAKIKDSSARSRHR